MSVVTRDFSPEMKSRYLTLNLGKNRVVGSDGKTYGFEVFFKSLNWVDFGQCYTFEVGSNIKQFMVRKHLH